jgi:L-asparaginase
MKVNAISTGLAVITLCAARALVPAAELPKPLPKVRLFSTGGTIQGEGPRRDEVSNYKAGKFTPKQLLDDLPEVSKIADASYEEIAAKGSGAIDTKIQLKLAKEINAWLAQPDSVGAVVTHGTATLEETAYFLNLVIRSDKPVLVVGAMRPHSAISGDGPLNLYNAFRTAIDPKARDKGVMVLLNDEINAARDVTKTNTERPNTFESRDFGPIGFADSDRIVFYRKLLYRHTHKSEFDVSELDELPKVDIAFGYQEGERTAVDALIAAGAKGIVLDDSAPGFNAAVKDGRAQGVVFVQSDRKGSGRVLETAGARERGVVTADNLNAQKARQLLRLALTKTSDPKEIQRMFDEY